MRKSFDWRLSLALPVALALAAPAPVAAQADAHQPAPAAEQPAPPAAGQPTPAPPVEHAPPADAHAPAPAHGDPAHPPAGEHAAAEAHAESPWGLIARIVNFLILVGGLVYFLRSPLLQHLTSRGQQIRGDIVNARETAERATARIAEIDARLRALPAEIEALKTRGAEEVAAEGVRIRQQAETERNRLLEQTRRDVDLQVRLAQAALTEHTANLAVQLAADRIKATITPADQARLIDQYVSNVKEIHG